MRLPFRKLWVAPIPTALLVFALLNQCSDNSLIAKKEITQKELDNPSSFKNIAYLEVDRTGKILIITATPSVSIRLVPEYKDGAIEWQCHGRPEKFVPANCRR
jgi:hypothetical protein